MQHNEYDITQAFQAIENELIASMIRNMDRHRAEETKEGMQWTQWQTEQLKSLERYKLENQKKYQKKFRLLNSRVDSLIRTARDTGNMEQEISILEAIKNGFKGTGKRSGGMVSAEFFRLNDRKLEALIKATTDDLKKAETAVLRMANDQYRKAIFNAQVYANTGAGTYEKAVDMATKDMLSRGLNCVEYKNGARHTLSDYADMAIRTAGKRAYLQGEGQKRQEWGISTVIMNKRGNPCPKCLPFVGKILIDDVWSGGQAKGANYPLMSNAVSRGLYHPRCRDSHTTYFPGISTADDTWTRDELEAIGQANLIEERIQYAARQAIRFGRLAVFSLEEGNQEKYSRKASEWSETVDNLPDNDILESEWSREAIEARLRDEKIVAGYKIEHAILYGSNGKRIFNKKGKSHSVEFSADDVARMSGGVLTHNHPLGATFSEADLIMLKKSKLSEIRAVGRDGVYVMKQPSKWPVEIESLKKMEGIYAEIDASLKMDMEKLFMKNKMSIQDYSIVYQDRIIQEMSKRYGLDYHMEAWKA